MENKTYCVKIILDRTIVKVYGISSKGLLTKEPKNLTKIGAKRLESKLRAFGYEVLMWDEE